MADQQYKFQGAKEKEEKLSKFDWVQQQLQSDKWKSLGTAPEETQQKVVSTLEKMYGRYELDYSGQEFTQAEVTNRGFGGTEDMRARAAYTRSNETAEEAAARLSPISKDFEDRFGKYEMSGYSTGYDETTANQDLGYGRTFIRDDGSTFDPYAGADAFSQEGKAFREYVDQQAANRSQAGQASSYLDSQVDSWSERISSKASSLSQVPGNVRGRVIQRLTEEREKERLERKESSEWSELYPKYTEEQVASFTARSELTGLSVDRLMELRETTRHVTVSDAQKNTADLLFGTSWGNLSEKQRSTVSDFNAGKLAGKIHTPLPAPSSLYTATGMPRYNVQRAISLPKPRTPIQTPQNPYQQTTAPITDGKSPYVHYSPEKIGDRIFQRQQGETEEEYTQRTLKNPTPQQIWGSERHLPEMLAPGVDMNDPNFSMAEWTKAKEDGTWQEYAKVLKDRERQSGSRQIT
jgi:hypothetical protein